MRTHSLRLSPRRGGCFVGAAATAALSLAAAAAGPPQFNRDVRPILAENCFNCHGADKHKAGLRLDLREVATRPADSGDTPIVPGKPAASELIARVTSDDDDLRMP